MNNKLYKCENPECNREVVIRSTIKSGELKGSKVCQACKSKLEGKVKVRSKLKPFSDKNKQKRKETRSELPDFFNSAIEELQKNSTCCNCGRKINSSYMPHWNIAHILPKQKYKSVMSHPLNWIPLCSSKDSDGVSDCHNYFDSNILEIPNMQCFKYAKEKFDKFKGEVIERGKIFSIFDEN